MFILNRGFDNAANKPAKAQENLALTRLHKFSVFRLYYIIATNSISNTNVEYAGMGPLAREP